MSALAQASASIHSADSHTVQAPAGMQEVYRTDVVHHCIVPAVDSHTAIAPAPDSTSVACVASVA